MKPRPKTAYAIVKKKENTINPLEIRPNKKDVILEKDEKWVRVEIRAVQ